MCRFAVLLIAAVLCTGAFARAYNPNPVVEINPVDRAKLPSDPAGAMRAARERVAAGDLPGAIRALELYVAGHPGEIGPARLLGDLYYRHGDLARAQGTYEHILAYAPKDKETHNRLGSVYATENRVDAAIDEFNRSLPGTDSVPDLVRLHERRGDLAAYRNEREHAALQYPNDAEAQLELAQVYLETHDYTNAVLYFRRALDDNASTIFAFNGLGLAYMDLHDYTGAFAQFDACLRHDPQNYPCADNLGAAYLETKQYGPAEAILNVARRLEPERSEALVNLGYLADARGDWKRAVSEYVQAMTVYPYSPDSYIDLGYTYDKHDLFALAQAALVKGLAVAPEDGRLHYLLGDVYARQGKLGLAQAQFQLAAASDDPDVRAVAQSRVAALLHPRS